MYSDFLQPTILEPTRIVTVNNSTSLIDNIFTNLYDKNNDHGNLLDKISYHLPNFVIIKDVCNKRVTQNNKIRDMKNFDENLYKANLIEIQKLIK